MKRILLFLLVCCAIQSRAQFLFMEDFIYSAGTSLNATGLWSEECFNGNDIFVSESGLTYPGYQGSGIGGLAVLSGNNDSFRSIGWGNSFPFFVSFMINVQSISSLPYNCTDGVLLNFICSGCGSNNDRERIGLTLQDQGGGLFRFGLKSRFGSTLFTSGTYSTGVTYLLIYRFEGSEHALRVNPVLGGGAPSWDIQQSHDAQNNNQNRLQLAQSLSPGGLVLIDGIRVATNWSDLLITSPSTQASNLTFTNVSATNMTLNWTNGNGNRMLVVAKAGSAVDAIPQSGMSYFGSSSFGSGTQIGSGNYVILNGFSDVTTPVSNLLPNTTYHFKVFAFNESGAIQVFNTDDATGNPASRSTLANEPVVLASAPTTATPNPNTLNINWTNGDGARRIVLARLNSAPAPPVDGTTYVANSIFGTGSQISSGTYVVYDGTGNSTTISGLTPQSSYGIAVYEYNGLALTSNFTSAANSTFISTVALEPTVQANNISFSLVTSNSMRVSWTNGNGTNRMLIGSAGPVTNFPLDGIGSYTSSSFFGSGSDLGGGDFLLYNGSGTFVDISGLTPSTSYTFWVVEYNGSGNSINYLTVPNGLNPQQRITLSNEPSNHAGLFTASPVLPTQVNLNFSAASSISNAAGYILLRRQDGTNPTATGIVDGTTTPVNPTAGTTLVTTISSTSTTSYADAGLTPGTQYNYALIPFGYNGSDPLTYNYRTAATIPVVTATTYSNEPTAHPASFTASPSGTNQVNLTFSAANTITNAAGYIILRRQDGANPTATGITDGVVTPANPTAGTNLVTTITNTATTSFADNTVSAGTQYNYSIIPYNIAGANVLTYNYRTAATILSANATTLSVEPTAHAALFTATASSSTQINLTFSAASTITGAAGYIILRRQDGTNPTATGIVDAATAPTNPVAGTTVITTITNTGTTTYSDLGLNPATQYNYAIIPFGYNGSNPLTYNFRTAATIPTSNIFTFSTEPASHASTFTATQASPNQINLTFSAANTISGAAGFIVLRRSDSNSPTASGVTDGVATPANPVAGTTLVTTITNTTTTSFNDTGVTPGARFDYALIPYGYNGTNAQTYNYRTAATIPVANAFTLSPEPSAHPASFTATQTGTSSINLTFSAASSITNASGYIILRREGSDPGITGITDGAPVPANPEAGTTLITTITNSSTTSFSDTGLSSGIQYNYSIIPYGYNGTNSQTYNYRTAATVRTANATTIVVEPGNQPTALAFSNLTPTSLTVSFTAAGGGAAGYIAFRRTGSSPTAIPVDGTTYTVGGSLGDGTIVYTGSAVSFNESGLTPNTEYFYDLFSYNGVGSTINYLASAPLEGNRFTLENEPTNQPTSLNFSTIGNISITGSFVGSVGGAAGYLVLRKEASAITASPADGSGYAVGNSVDDAIVVQSSAATTFNDSGLTSGVVYHYSIFAFNGTGSTSNYLSAAPLAQSTVTLTNTPVLNTPGSITSSSFLLSWAAIANAANYSLDVSLSENFTSFVTGYENLTVAGTSQPVTGLISGTVYYARLRASNSQSVASPSSTHVSVLTLPAAPVAVAPTPNSAEITTTSFVAKWNATTGADNYEVEISSSATFATLLNGYPKTVGPTILSETVIGLTAGTDYYFRVRAKNTSGNSTFSSEVNVITVPNVPVTELVTVKSANTFIAEWQPVPGASSYELDVTAFASDFATFISGYQARSVTSTSEVVSGLTSKTPYKFRVRAVNAGGKSANSAARGVITDDSGTGGSTFDVTSTLVNNGLFTQGTANLNVTGQIANQTGTTRLTLRYKGVTETTFKELQSSTTTNSFQFEINDSMLDELGLEYYIRGVDDVDQIDSTSILRLFRNFDNNNSPVFLQGTFGGTNATARIIAIPYELADNNIDFVFASLGQYNKELWRIARYQNDRLVEFGEGILKIERGQGYWFNARNSLELTFNTGAGRVAENYAGKPYSLTLVKGWNQIGNPYPFSIDWTDVKAINSSVPGVSDAFYFANPDYTKRAPHGTLLPFEGAFVFADPGGILTIPVSLKGTAGGRTNKSEPLSDNLDEPAWKIDFTISQGSLNYSLMRVGMHPEASPSKDVFDDMLLPRMGDYLEAVFHHPEYFYPYFAADIQPTTDRTTWEFEVRSNSDTHAAQLAWKSNVFNGGNAQVFLLNKDNGDFINMKSQGNYAFHNPGTTKFQLYYVKDAHETVIPELVFVTDPYPNPLTEQTNCNLILAPRNEPYQVQASMYDLQGRKVSQIFQGQLESGIHVITWAGIDAQNGRVAPGLYFMRIQVDNTAFEAKKIIVR